MPSNIFNEKEGNSMKKPKPSGRQERRESFSNMDSSSQKGRGKSQTFAGNREKLQSEKEEARFSSPWINEDGDAWWVRLFYSQHPSLLVFHLSRINRFFPLIKWINYEKYLKFLHLTSPTFQLSKNTHFFHT